MSTHRESRPSCSGGRRRRPAPRQSRRAPPPQAQPSAAHGPPASPTAASSASAADSASACRILHLPRRASSLPRLGGARSRPARIVPPAASATTDCSLHSLCTANALAPLGRDLPPLRGDARLAIRSIYIGARGAAGGGRRLTKARANRVRAARGLPPPPRVVVGLPRAAAAAGAAMSVASYLSPFTGDCQLFHSR